MKRSRAHVSYEQRNSKAAHVGHPSLKIHSVPVKLKLKRLYLLFSSLKFSKMSWNVYQFHFLTYLIKWAFIWLKQMESPEEVWIDFSKKGVIGHAFFKYAFLISFFATIISFKCWKYITALLKNVLSKYNGRTWRRGRDHVSHKDLNHSPQGWKYHSRTETFTFQAEHY